MKRRADTLMNAERLRNERWDVVVCLLSHTLLPYPCDASSTHVPHACHRDSKRREEHERRKASNERLAEYTGAMKEHRYGLGSAERGASMKWYMLGEE